jgi:rare lipoprotein A (peptidoglycan hydrolase)
VALISALVAVAVPGSAGSIATRLIGTPSAALFDVKMAVHVRGPVTTSYALDPADRSADTLDHRSILHEPNTTFGRPQARPRTAQPEPTPNVIRTPAWRLDGNVSWYGPGFYGNRTACGLAMTRDLVGVAHRTLPCGTKVTFRNPDNGRTVTAPVVDRGPYVAGRQWDLTRGLCMKLDHCHTGALYWRRAGD